MTLNSFQVEVEEEKPEIIIKEKKETKKSKSWGRRSTRAKKTISYRYETYYFAARSGNQSISVDVDDISVCS